MQGLEGSVFKRRVTTACWSRRKPGESLGRALPQPPERARPADTLASDLWAPGLGGRELLARATQGVVLRHHSPGAVTVLNKWERRRWHLPRAASLSRGDSEQESRTVGGSGRRLLFWAREACGWPVVTVSPERAAAGRAAPQGRQSQCMLPRLGKLL